MNPRRGPCREASRPADACGRLCGWGTRALDRGGVLWLFGPIDDAASGFITASREAPPMKKTPRYTEGKTRDPRNPPDEEMSFRKPGAPAKPPRDDD